MTGRAVNDKKIAKAIPESGGLISVIAKRCGYHWHSVRTHIDRNPELLQALENEENAVDDLAESVMIGAMREKDRAAAQWWLARRRRKKYGDNVDVTTGGDKLPQTQIIVTYERKQNNS